MPALVNLAALRQQQGRLEEAVAGYRQALAIAPGSWKAEFNLGSALAARRDFAAATAAFERAVCCSPTTPMPKPD